MGEPIPKYLCATTPCTYGNCQIIDITHQIIAQNLIDAMFCICRYVPYFPKGTIHLAVVDPGVGSTRKSLLIQCKDYYLVGPDNAIFTKLLEMENSAQVYKIHEVTPYWKKHTSFDGLHLFAPVVAHLSGNMKPDQIGKPIKHFQKIKLPDPLCAKNKIQGKIVCFDHFGNAITNISNRLKSKTAKKWEIRCNETNFPFGNHYSQSESALSHFNSDGLLELSCYEKSAKEVFQLKTNMDLEIKIIG